MSYEDKMNPTSEWPGFYYSAYGIAVKHGFEGTEEEWLAYIHGNVDLTLAAKDVSVRARNEAVAARNEAVPAKNTAVAAAEDAEEAKTAAESVSSALTNTMAGISGALVGKSFYTATTAAGMTDTSKTYIYIGSEQGYNTGHWYYYDNGVWTDGGDTLDPTTALRNLKTLGSTGYTTDLNGVGLGVWRCQSNYLYEHEPPFNSHFVLISMETDGAGNTQAQLAISQHARVRRIAYRATNVSGEWLDWKLLAEQNDYNVEYPGSRTYWHYDAFPGVPQKNEYLYTYRAVVRSGRYIWFACRYSDENPYYLGRIDVGSSRFYAAPEPVMFDIAWPEGTYRKDGSGSGGTYVQVSDMLADNGRLYVTFRGQGGSETYDGDRPGGYLLVFDENSSFSVTQHSASPVVAEKYWEKVCSVTSYHGSHGNYLATGNRKLGWTLYDLDNDMARYNWTGNAEDHQEYDDAHPVYEWQHGDFFEFNDRLHIAWGNYSYGCTVYGVKTDGAAPEIVKCNTFGKAGEDDPPIGLDTIALHLTVFDMTSVVIDDRLYLYGTVSPTITYRKTGNDTLGIVVIPLTEDDIETDEASPRYGFLSGDIDWTDKTVVPWAFYEIPQASKGNAPTYIQYSADTGKVVFDSPADASPNHIEKIVVDSTRTVGDDEVNILTVKLIFNNEDKGLAVFETVVSDRPDLVNKYYGVSRDGIPAFLGNISLGDVWPRYFTLDKPDDDPGVIYAGSTYAFVKGEKNYLTAVGTPE